MQTWRPRTVCSHPVKSFIFTILHQVSPKKICARFSKRTSHPSLLKSDCSKTKVKRVHRVTSSSTRCKMLLKPLLYVITFPYQEQMLSGHTLRNCVSPHLAPVKTNLSENLTEELGKRIDQTGYWWEWWQGCWTFSSFLFLFLFLFIFISPFF